MNVSIVGTFILGEATSQSQIIVITAKDAITAIRIQSFCMPMPYGFLTKVFGVFERYRTSINMITISEVVVSLTIYQTDYLSEINCHNNKLSDKN